MEKKFNYKLFISLMILNFIPAIHDTLKVLFINNSAVSLSVVGNIEWFDLFNEAIIAFLTIPLYTLLNKYIDEKNDFTSKVSHITFYSFIIYGIISLILYINAGTLVEGMAAQDIAETTRYLQMETIAFVAGFLFSVFSIIFVLLNKSKVINAFIVIKTVALIFGDLVLIPAYGSLGIAYSNLFVNLALTLIGLVILYKEGYIRFNIEDLKPDWSFDKKWLIIGILSGLEIAINNVFYANMICKMVNVVQQSGNYWVANNFIWGWLLVPSYALAEIIKKDCKEGYENLNLVPYKKIVAISSIIWVITIPLWKGIFKKFMGIEDPQTIFTIVIMLLPFYVAYLISVYIDSIFYGLGRTDLTLSNSIIVNVVYYGILYVLYSKGIITPSINFIVLMFGFGMVVHTIISCVQKKLILDKKIVIKELLG